MTDQLNSDAIGIIRSIQERKEKILRTHDDYLEKHSHPIYVEWLSRLPREEFKLLLDAMDEKTAQERKDLNK